VPVATPDVSDAAVSEDFIQPAAGPFSSAVLSRDALQATLPNLAGRNGEIQLNADTGNNTASESNREAAHKPRRVATPKAALAELRSLPVPADAGTAEWKKEDENQKALATKWCDRYNTVRELACKIPGYNDPRPATRDADLAEIRPLPPNADATELRKKAENCRFLATGWRSRYSIIVNELVLKSPDCKATDVPPPQNISLHAQTYLSNDYRVEPKPTIVTAGDRNFGKIAADSESVLLLDPFPAALRVGETKELGTSIYLITDTKAPDEGDTPRLCGTSTRRQLHTSENVTFSEECVQNPSGAVVEAIGVSMNFPESSSATSVASPAANTLVEVLAPLCSITASQQAVHEKPRVTRFSTPAPPKFAAPLARTKPTAAIENDSFLPLYHPLPSSIRIFGY
jgi:hypothetical protein